MIVALVTMASKIFSGLKDLLIAARLGTGEELDVYFTAFLLPASLANVVSFCLAASFLPQFEKATTQDGDHSAWRLYSTISYWGLGLALAVTLVLSAASRYCIGVIARGFSPQKLNDAAHCLSIMAPLLIVTTVGGLWSAILASRRLFAITASVPLITTCSIILVASTSSFRRASAAKLSWGTLIGGLVEVAALGAALWYDGFHIVPGSVESYYSRRVRREFLLLTASSVAMLGVPVITQSIAAGLANGTIAAINYGSKATAILVQLTQQVIGTVVMPHLSALAAREDWLELKKLFAGAGVLTMFGLIPIVGLLSWQSEALVRLLFQHGNFKAEDTTLVASIQSWYLLQVPFICLGMIASRLLMSMEQNRLIVITGFLNVVFLSLTARWFVTRLGAAGVGAALSAMYAIATLYLAIAAWWIVRIRHHGKKTRSGVYDAVR